MCVKNAVVTEVGENDFLGKYVKYETENGLVIINGHLSKTLIKQNDKIHKNQKIGIIGNTGISTGIHLHYSIKKNNQYIDPFNYVNLTYTKDVEDEYIARGDYIWK